MLLPVTSASAAAGAAQVSFRTIRKALQRSGTGGHAMEYLACFTIGAMFGVFVAVVIKGGGRKDG